MFSWRSSRLGRSCVSDRLLLKRSTRCTTARTRSSPSSTTTTLVSTLASLLVLLGRRRTRGRKRQNWKAEQHAFTTDTITTEGQPCSISTRWDCHRFVTCFFLLFTALFGDRLYMAEALRRSVTPGTGPFPNGGGGGGAAAPASSIVTLLALLLALRCAVAAFTR